MSASRDRHEADRSRYPILALLTFTALFTLAIGHGLTFRHDEWNVIQSLDTGGFGTLLRSINGQSSFFPLLFYRALLAVVGLHYFWFRVLLAGYNFVLGYLSWRLLARRLPGTLALACTALIVLCGGLYENYLFPIQIGYVGALIGYTAALNLLDDDHDRPVALCACLVFSVFSSSIGVAGLVGVLVEVVWRRRPALTVACAIAGALWLAWYSGYGESAAGSTAAQQIGFFTGLAAYTVTGTAGLWPLFHLSHPELRIAALAVVAVILIALRGLSARGLIGARQPRDGAVSRWPRATNLAVMVLAFWVLTALARGQLYAYRSRYISPGAIGLILLLAQYLDGRTLRVSLRRLLAATGAVIAIANLPFLIHNASKYRATAQALTGQLAALELVGPGAPAQFEPSPDSPQVQTSLYFAAIHRLRGDPALSASQLVHADEVARVAADQALLRLSLAIHPASCDAARTLTAAQLGDVAAGSELRFTDRAATAQPIDLRRFGGVPTPLPHPLAPGRSIVIELERDAEPVPWQVSVASPVVVARCG